MKQLTYILAIIPWLIILGMVLCRKPAHTDMIPRSQFTALQERLNDTSAAYEQFRRKSDSAIDNATAMAVQASEQLKESNDKLNDTKGTVKWLLSELDKADAQKPDSSWVSVSPEYKNDCDSLREVNGVLLGQIDNYQQGAEQQADILAYELRLRDSIIEQERGFNDMFKKSLQDCIAIGKQAQKSAAPRNQLYAGFGAIGSQLNPLAGGEVNLSLKTKADQIYEVRGALIATTWYVGLGTKFKLHF
jgi:hypothetical protein